MSSRMTASKSRFLKTRLLCCIGLTTLTLPLIGCNKSESAPAVPVSQAALKTDSIRHNFPAGERRVYSFSYENGSRMDTAKMLGSEAKQNPASPFSTLYDIQTSLRGELEMTVLRQEANGNVLIAYRFLKPEARLLINAEDKKAEAGQMQSDLERTQFAIVTPQGKVESLHIDKATSALSRKGAAALPVALMQFVMPDKGGAETWQSTEEDPSAEYTAEYKRDKGAEKGNTHVYRKTKVAIASPDAVGPNHAMVTMKLKPTGSLLIGFDTQRGCVESVEGEEDQITYVGEKPVANSRNRIKIKLTRVDRASEGELTTLAQAEKQTEALKMVSRQNETEDTGLRRIHERELGTASEAELFRMLAKEEADKNPSFDPLALTLKFKALVYLKPETSDSLGKELATAKGDSLAMRILSSALGEVGHPQAQKALIAAMKGRNDWQGLYQMIPTLGSVSYPLEETEKIIRDLTNHKDENVATTATLTLGIMLGNLSAANSPRAAVLLQMLEAKLKSSKDMHDKATVLMALGNSAQDRVFPMLKEYASSPNAEVRASAVRAMRALHPEEIETIVDRLAEDKEANVRNQAVYAMEHREPNESHCKILLTRLAKDNNTEVKQSILSLIARSYKTYAGTKSQVEVTAQKDSSAEIRKMAAEILKAW